MKKILKLVLGLLLIGSITFGAVVDTATAGSDSAEAAAVGAYSTSVVFELITL